MATSGTSSAFLHQETHPGEITADRNGNVITNTSLSLKAVAIAILVPIGNGLISESSTESIATKTTEATMAEDALTQTEHPLVNQGIAKLKAEKGKSVVLPCLYLNNNTSLNKDSVLWYREDATEKFYPVRDNTTGSGIYSGRVFLSGNLSNGDASLTILNVTKRDNGTYFCTVRLNNRTTLNGDGTHLMVKSKEGDFTA
ncbi:hypothetical protein chiPu_0006944 [Chiloscyllium punctatum]|uniref:Ig-like domain-containing protein n=1 Tax=Chiloscyllium punctatum TaxID=137246 RepID=A0A401SDT2_CHIPU|nr:hypothetical protein [Chiloscyllium punctatum]